MGALKTDWKRRHRKLENARRENAGTYSWWTAKHFKSCES